MPAAALDVPLAPLTTLGLGGPARRLLEVSDDAELREAVLAADAAGEPVLILGGGSNVVIADAGFAGTVIRIATRGVTRRRDGDHVLVDVAAGEPWDALVAACVADRLAGIECLAGIPGLTGATPIQNVGAYGQDVAETITAVRVLDREDGAVRELPAADCGFRYRSSAFKGSPRHVVLGVTYRLRADAAESQPIAYAELARTLGAEPGDRAPLAAAREAVLALRRGKGMVLDPDDPDTRSAGSFFTNPILDADAFAALTARVAERLGPDARPPAFPEPDGRTKTSAAWLIDRAGFGPGTRRGNVAQSGKHALALVNLGDGTTTELVALAREIAAGVQAAFGVALVPEPVFVGHRWDG
ncbi:UDP-N-acetylmuramate dehydrogenase [Svornostia abyssi]|uniref:UDP-N-acetylenolpyruvoylglucosamine reductase n=1 Tax=Svornostia abyssi TaxID=2898438 RepID=A0ABY5PBI6_9ACTN|nr:UDP-N-acetylmuramate dehydrogenase [Parviterribacteraceae bacterium J379]